MKRGIIKARKANVAGPAVRPIDLIPAWSETNVPFAFGGQNATLAIKKFKG